jgi:AraC-like DNA-binding protein
MRMPKVSVSAAKALYSHLLDQGATQTSLDQVCGIGLSELDPNTDRLDLHCYHALWEFALDFTGNPSLGLTLGSNERTEFMSLLSHLFFSSATLRDALALYQRFYGFINESVKISLQFRDGDVLVQYRISEPEHYCVPDMERTLAVAVHRARTHISPVIHLSHVAFQHGVPSYRDCYAACFPCEIRFGQRHCAIAFPEQYLDHLLPERSSSLNHLLLQQLESVLDRTNRLELRVRGLIHEHLEDGRGSSDDIARYLCISRHTLYRRLKQEGLSFHQLLDEVRREKALAMITNSKLALSEIALKLGFSEQSAFSRAFKRWTGTSPGKYVR